MCQTQAIMNSPWIASYNTLYFVQTDENDSDREDTKVVLKKPSSLNCNEATEIEDDNISQWDKKQAQDK